MPMAPMLATSAASDISPGWIFRGLPGFFLRQRGSTRRSSICSLLVSSDRGLSSKTKPGERGRTGRGKGGAKRRDSARLSEASGRTRPLRRTGVPCFFSHFLLLDLMFASCREQVGLRRRGLRRGRRRGRRRLALGAVFRLQASEGVQLALSGRIGLAHAENVDHVGGPQVPLDGALDVAECVGRIAVATPTKRLIEEN